MPIKGILFSSGDRTALDIEKGFEFMQKIHEREGSEGASTASTEVTSGGLGGCAHDILLSSRVRYSDCDLHGRLFLSKELSKASRLQAEERWRPCRRRF